MALELGRMGRLYVVAESAFGVSDNPASADAIRHVNFLATHDPTSKRNSPEKKHSPGRATRFTGREVAALGQVNALIRPSGTLNTLPEASEIFEAAFGAKTNVELATTVASGASVDGCVVASGTGLAVNGAVSIVCLDGKRRVRRLTSVAGTTIGWAPSLPTIPAVGAAVKSATVYQLTTGLAKSLSFFHYLMKVDGSTAGFARALRGVGIDRMSMMFDANNEPTFTASGPAGTMSTAAVPSKPAAFTTVGGNPPSGLTGELQIGANVMTFLKAQIEITNGLVVRNRDYGTSTASELYRENYREISVGVDCSAEDETDLYDTTEAGSNIAMLLQTGYTEGNIICVIAPQVEFKVPDQDDPDTTVNWSFKGAALESADNQNDELFLVFA